MSFIGVVLEEFGGKKFIHRISFNGLMVRQSLSKRQQERPEQVGILRTLCLKIYMRDLRQSSAMVKSRNLALI